MKRSLVSLVLLISLPILVSTGTAGGGKLALKAEKLIKSVLSKNLTLQHREYKIPAPIKTTIEAETDQEFYRDTVVLWEVNRENGERAYVLMDDVSGRHMPITFFVVFDASGHILGCRVVKYRERYGSGVKSKRWLRQFTGKNATSGFKVGKDIDAISGATISSNSVTKGIKKLAKLISHILE